MAWVFSEEEPASVCRPQRRVRHQVHGFAVSGAEFHRFYVDGALLQAARGATAWLTTDGPLNRAHCFDVRGVGPQGEESPPGAPYCAGGGALVPDGGVVLDGGEAPVDVRSPGCARTPATGEAVHLNVAGVLGALGVAPWLRRGARRRQSAGARLQ
ncbi:MAG: hypothetical protein HY904_07675 [Deltaproteobacteria bacterium]|nr:hypothetical protein [Deltaproteobacteria bacterium]